MLMMTTPLPPEVSLRILEASAPETWKAWLLADPAIRALLTTEEAAGFWRWQCQVRGYSGHTLAHFRHLHLTHCNWLRSNYSRRTIPTAGQICYFLDGRRNRALSATLSAPECRFWDLETGKGLLRAEGGVTCAALAGNLLGCGHRDGRLTLRDIRDGQVSHAVVAHHGEVSVLEMQGGGGNGGRLFVTGSVDGTVQIWDVRAGLRSLSTEQAGAAITGVAISKQPSTCIAYATVKGLANIIIPAGGTDGQAPAAPLIDATEGGAINCVRFRGDQLLLGSDDGNIRIYAPCDHTLYLIPASNSSSSPITSLHIHHDRLVAGHASGLITGRHLSRRGHPPSPPQPRIMTIREERSIIWQLYTDRERILSSSLDNRLYVHSFSPADQSHIIR